jgi:hypothetical protein
VLALVYFVLQALWRLPDPYWLISMLSFLPLIPMNKVALDVNYTLHAQFKNNERFSAWNWVALILGGALLILDAIGIFFPIAPSP